MGFSWALPPAVSMWMAFTMDPVVDTYSPKGIITRARVAQGLKYESGETWSQIPTQSYSLLGEFEPVKITQFYFTSQGCCAGKVEEG